MIIETILSTVIGGAISGIIGNRSDSIAMNTMNRIIDNFDKNKRLINHDLQKAVLRSYYLALKSICEDCLDKENDNKRVKLWLECEIEEIKDIMRKIEKNEYSFLPIEEIDKIKLLITTEESASKINNEKEKLIAVALDRDCQPKYYVELVKSTLYQRVCALFAFEIKHNQIINNIFQSQLLTNIDIKVSNLADNLLMSFDNVLPMFKNSLKKIEQTMIENNNTFDDVKSVFINLSTNNADKLDDIIAILKEKSISLETQKNIARIKSFDIKIGDYILFGKYKDEQILWEIINIDDNGNPLAFSKYILCHKAYDSKESEDAITGTFFDYSDERIREYEGSNRWSNSNIREWLNSGNNCVLYSTAPPKFNSNAFFCMGYEKEEGFLRQFSLQERCYIKITKNKTVLSPCDVSNRNTATELYKRLEDDCDENYENCFLSWLGNTEGAYSEYTEDRVFLLSLDELFKFVFKRGLSCSKYLKDDKPVQEIVNMEEKKKNDSFLSLDNLTREFERKKNFYYLRTPLDVYGNTVIKYNSGDTNYPVDGAGLAYVGYGICPACYINISKVMTVHGEGSFEIPYIFK